MSALPRAVFDTGVLVSALLLPSSMPRRSLLAARPLYDVCVSAETLAELGTVLRRSKFDKYQPVEVRREFVDLYATQCLMVHVDAASDEAARGACRDPADAIFLALALAAGAEVLVTGDDDLLVLDGWKGLAIVRPSRFVEALQPD
jgi:uncharacterized protein